MFSGSSGVSTPLSGINPGGGRRSSLTFSPKRSFEASNTSGGEDSSRKTSFVSKTTVFLDDAARPKEVEGILNMNDNSSSRVLKFDSSSLPTSPTSDEPSSILKRKGSMNSSKGTASPNGSFDMEPASASGGSSGRPRKRSILKHDLPDEDTSVMIVDEVKPRRGVLKKDSSYDDGLRPILKNPEDYVPPVVEAAAAATSSNYIMNESVSSTSSEDLENLLDQNNRGFVDVVIDPVPKDVPMDAGTSSEEELKLMMQNSPRKASLTHHGPRQPVIPPSSVKISADGNLAGKLQMLSGQAEAKLRQIAAAEAQEAVAVVRAHDAAKPPVTPEKR